MSILNRAIVEYLNDNHSKWYAIYYDKMNAVCIRHGDYFDAMTESRFYFAYITLRFSDDTMSVYYGDSSLLQHYTNVTTDNVLEQISKAIDSINSKCCRSIMLS